MPRLMAVALTREQVRDRSKTVTRRQGRLMLKPGDTVTLCEQVQGLKKGEHPVRITDIEIVSVRRERLDAITAHDVAAEGFPGWTPDQFVSFFTDSHKGCEPCTVITRIEWRYVGPPASAVGAPDQGPPVRCPDVEADIIERLERFFWDLLGTVLIGGREFRSLYLEEARALGYADSSPAVLLRREDDGTVFEVGIGVTAREVRRAPVPPVLQEAQASSGAEGDGGD
jgi:hypothetical protein